MEFIKRAGRQYLRLTNLILQELRRISCKAKSFFKINQTKWLQMMAQARILRSHLTNATMEFSRL